MLHDDTPGPSRLSATLIEWLRGQGRILIVAHDNPDPDALASATALQQLLLVKTGIEAVITHGGIVGRRENQALVAELGIRTQPIATLDLQPFDVICMVDTQPGAGNNSWPVVRSVDIVIDHHPLLETTRRSRWVDVRPDYGSCATILYEYLVNAEVHFRTQLATLLLYAIKTETQDLGREWVPADRNAYQKLLTLCNNQVLARIAHPKVPHAYFSCFNRAIAGARIYDQVLLFNLSNVDSPDIVAEMADFLLRAEEVETVFGMGHFAGDAILSLRTSSDRFGAGRLMASIVAGIGSGGGHLRIAGGQIPQTSGERAALSLLFTQLSERLLTELKVRTRRGRRLVPRSAACLPR